MDPPAGVICFWSGAIIAIPAGYVICDGNNGTPDLRNRFVVGAGDEYAVDDIGGRLTHTHDFTGDGHTHNIDAGTQILAGTDLNEVTASENATGTTDLATNTPLFYALAYIMKT